MSDKIIAIPKQPLVKWPTILLAATYILVAAVGLYDYISWTSVNVIIGACAMPLLLEHTRKQQYSNRFFLFALALCLIGILVPVKTALYLSLCCTLLYVYESSVGRLTLLPFTTLFLMSPICQYLAHVFSFPIRLWLTTIAATILNWAGLSTKVAGNIISFQQTEFSVDPACLGLNMLVTSLLCGVIIIGFYQKRMDVQLKLHWIFMALMMLVGLNIIANLMRILILVYFKIMPEHFLHDITGLISLSIYVLIPSMFLLKMLVRKKGKALEQKHKTSSAFRQQYWPHAILILGIAITSWRISTKTDYEPSNKLPAILGYQSSWFDNDVLKLKSNNALIYVKALKGFVYTDHNPLICWTGSGYTFEQIEEQHWGELTLFTGVLVNGNDKLYTAWWYDNGITNTTEQWKWRWEMFCGSNAFAIINVTASSIDNLRSEVKAFNTVKSKVFHHK